MQRIVYKAVPFMKEDVTLALESGVDGLIVPDAMLESASGLARSAVLPQSRAAFMALSGKEDEEHAASLALRSLRSDSLDAAEPQLIVLARGWEIIPVENLLAAIPDAPHTVERNAFDTPLQGLALEAGSLDEALVASGILERGVDTIVLTPEALPQIQEIVARLKQGGESMHMQPALITRIVPAGMGHRVCVDTTSRLRSGQGMLVGNSAAFTFLVHAETEHNEYVASRPFRINAGAVHAYAIMPGDRTCYLDELAAGKEVLIADKDGSTSAATVGRVKVERRPMLLVEASLAVTPHQDETHTASGTVILQNAETIRLLTPDGRAVSVVSLRPGDQVLVRVDQAGRHFGMRITEDIAEE